MNLDKRSHNFLLFRELKNYIGTGKLKPEDYQWMVEYLEDRLEYYVSPHGFMKCSLCGSTSTCQTCKNERIRNDRLL